MKRANTLILFAALIWTSGQTLAADPMPYDSMSGSKMNPAHQKMMRDCMAKQKAKDSSMSKEDMKKACMDEMKMKQDPSTDHSMDHSMDHPTTPPK